ncbi:MAG: hypothetical protein QOE18_1632 [Chloroflexota bacterium]|nr:hypothetical protein [Chloroflexota bacterium]
MPRSPISEGRTHAASSARPRTSRLAQVSGGASPGRILSAVRGTGNDGGGGGGGSSKYGREAMA